MESDQAAIPCPLCSYDLRGLPEPRCPECGAVYSSWQDLTDPARRKHPYLFEHHPERNVRSFLQTWLHGWWPWSFWSSLHPAQNIHRRRLLIYWLICCALFLTSGAMLPVRDMLILRHVMLDQRAQQTSYFNGSFIASARKAMPPRGYLESLQASFDAERRALVARYGSVQAGLDQRFPTPPRWAFFSLWASSYEPFHAPFRRLENSPQIVLLVMMSLAPLIPSALVGVMLIFRASMRRSGVRIAHLCRVAIYCSDLLMVPFLLLAAIYAWHFWQILSVASTGFPILRTWWSDDNVALALAGAILLGSIFLTVRLAIAMGRYLQFKHAAAMAISVLIILGLLLLNLISAMQWP